MPRNQKSWLLLIVLSVFACGCAQSKDEAVAKAKAEAEAAQARYEAVLAEAEEARADAEAARAELARLKGPAAAVVENKADESVGNPHHLGLMPPKVAGLEANINGAVNSQAGVQRIVWNWGDGTPESESWFPAKHRYAKGGTYQVRVMSFDAPGKTSTTTTTVVVSDVPDKKESK